MNTLIGELSPYRRRLVEEAFQWLDANKSGTLDLDEVKGKFDPTRHPDVKARIKTVEEARFEFFNLFTNLHSANKGFTNDREVTLADFMDYHQYISTQFERDHEFKTLISGIWNMDLAQKSQYKGIAGAPAPGKFMKNSREQWKYDFHRPAIMGNDEGKTVIQHDIEYVSKEKTTFNDLKTAGCKTFEPDQTKGISVKGDMATRKDLAREHSKSPSKIKVIEYDVLDLLRARLKSRGARGIAGLGRSFRVIDDDNSGALCPEEFFKALRDYRITHDPEEMQSLFDRFDIN